MEPNQYSVTIKRGNMEFKFDRVNLINVEQSHDGVVFNFKFGVIISVTDNYMPLETKQLIKNADILPNGNIVYDLNNYKQPAVLSLS
jgi:shikimate 5-dehydrogenase